MFHRTVKRLRRMDEQHAGGDQRTQAGDELCLKPSQTVDEVEHHGGDE